MILRRGMRKRARDPWGSMPAYHPPASQYIDVHKHCLHLWRPIGIEIPMPPLELV